MNSKSKGPSVVISELIYQLPITALLEEELKENIFLLQKAPRIHL